MMDIIYLAQTLSDLNNDDANEGTFFDTKEEAMRFADSVPSIVRITALDINSGDREVVWSGEEETPLEEKKENVKYDSITQEVHDRSKLLRNVSVPVVYYLVNFYAADNGLKRSKVNPIDAAEYFDDFGSTGAICLDLWWDADLSDSNAQELALADPKFVETLRKLGDEMGVNNDPDGRPTEDKLSDEELFRWNFVDGIDEETRDEVIADFKKMYYDIKEEFSVAELDKFANDDAVYDDPFDIDFDVEPAESEPAEVDTGKKVPEIPNFSGSVELGDEPESVVNVTRSSSLLGGEHENLVDINVQCEDSDEDLTAALKELICSLGLEDEFNLDSCDPECESPECPEEPVEPAEEPAVEPAVEPEEVKDLSKEDEVKVEMPEKVADEVKDGDMLVVKVDNKEKPELEEPEDDDDMTDEEFFEELGKELKNSRSCSEAVHEESEDGEIIHISDDALNGLDLDDEERDWIESHTVEEAWNAHEKFVNPGVEDERPELEADNAVKKCKTYKVVAHCAEENIDCEMKKPALDKPLLEDINNVFDLFEDADMPDDELPEDQVEEPAADKAPEVPEEEPAEETPVEEPAELDDKLLADLIKDEVEAIDGYKDAKEEITDPESLETIEDIESEEVDHIDRLADLLGKEPKVDELVESLQGDEVKEFFRLCDEIGLKTVDDLEAFSKEFPTGNVLDNLRKYRDELGPDFNLPPEERGMYRGDVKEDLIIEDFPEPEGEPMSDKELEDAMGIKEPEEK